MLCSCCSFISSLRPSSLQWLLTKFKQCQEACSQQLLWCSPSAHLSRCHLPKSLAESTQKMRGNSGYCISLQTNARVFSTKCSNSSETRYIEQRTGKQARCGPHTLRGLSQAARLPLSLSNLLKDSFVWVLILNSDSIYIILTVTARAQSSWDRRYGVFNESGIITFSHQDHKV